MLNFLEKLNESTNLLAVAFVAAGVVLVLRGHTDAGLITGAFALLNSSITSSKKTNQNPETNSK